MGTRIDLKDRSWTMDFTKKMTCTARPFIDSNICIIRKIKKATYVARGVRLLFTREVTDLILQGLWVYFSKVVFIFRGDLLLFF